MNLTAAHVTRSRSIVVDLSVKRKMHTKKERLGALYPQRTDVRNNAHGFYDFSIIVDVFAAAVCADGCSSTPARCRRHWRKRSDENATQSKQSQLRSQSAEMRSASSAQ